MTESIPAVGRAARSPHCARSPPFRPPSKVYSLKGGGPLLSGLRITTSSGTSVRGWVQRDLLRVGCARRWRHSPRWARQADARALSRLVRSREQHERFEGADERGHVYRGASTETDGLMVESWRRSGAPVLAHQSRSSAAALARGAAGHCGSQSLSVPGLLLKPQGTSTAEPFSVSSLTACKAAFASVNENAVTSGAKRSSSASFRKSRPSSRVMLATLRI